VSDQNGDMRKLFRNRTDAGLRLAELLVSLDLESPLVLALPRGGVPVAAPVADRLGCELDVLLVRKIGHPRQPELALGAIGESGVTFINQELVERLGVEAAAIEPVVERERVELLRRAKLYRAGRPATEIAGREVVIVDDGIATGSTVLAAIKVARQAGAKKVIVATPVAPPEVAGLLVETIDELVVVETPRSLGAVGQFYQDFSQTTDEEVLALLESH